MSAADVIYINETTPMLALMGKALISNKKSASPEIPSVALRLQKQSIDPKHLKQYAKVCGFDIKQGVPITYPHMLGFPLHLELMLRKDFPYAVMGLVHVNNSITQHKAINPTDLLDVQCRFGSIEEHSKGKIINIITEVFVNDELVWESTSAMLKRMKMADDGNKSDKAKEASSPISTVFETWKLGGNLGRRYGSVSGDRNPIHLFALSAKLFGFKRHIAHGMWTKARVAAAMSDKIADNKATLAVEFKLPIFLPGKVRFYQQTTAKGVDLEVWDNKGEKPHLKGSLTL